VVRVIPEVAVVSLTCQDSSAGLRSVSAISAQIARIFVPEHAPGED
jgi:hypothetical protein